MYNSPMLKITNLNVKLKSEETQILQNINLSVNENTVCYISGRNGSGKSSLVSTIMGNPNFSVVSGKIEIVNEKYSSYISEKFPEDILDKEDTIDLTNQESNIRSLAGIFLANQYPLEIPGVSLLNFLRLIYNSRRSKEDQMPVFKFKRYIEELANLINYPKTLLDRNLNEGFSGGEKKKTEILQLLVLAPKYAMLDEVDSGLDKQSIKEVFSGLSGFQKMNKTSFIIISHYDQVQDYLQPKFSYKMESGNLLSE
jgi:Fe-S cluster assembly ATP-binding protein